MVVQILITSGRVVRETLTAIVVLLCNNAIYCSVLASMNCICDHFIYWVSWKGVCIILCLLSFKYCSSTISCRSFQAWRWMALFGRWWNRAITLDVFWLKIVNIQCIDLWCWSGCLWIQILIESFVYLMLKFEFIIEVTAIILRPEVVEVVKSIIDTWVRTYWHLIAI